MNNPPRQQKEYKRKTLPAKPTPSTSKERSKSRSRSPSVKTKKPMPKELIMQCIDKDMPGMVKTLDSSSEESDSGWNEIESKFLTKNKPSTSSNMNQDDPEPCSSKNINLNSNVESIENIKSNELITVLKEIQNPISASESEYYSTDDEDELNLETIEYFRGYPDEDDMIKSVISIDPKVETKQERKLIQKMVTTASKINNGKPSTSSITKAATKAKPSYNMSKLHPGRHRIKVYEKPMLTTVPLGNPKKAKESPYACDYIDIDGTLKLGTKNFDAYITNAEYQLLKEFKIYGMDLINDSMPEKPKVKPHHSKSVTVKPKPIMEKAGEKGTRGFHHLKSIDTFSQTEDKESSHQETQTTRRVEFNLERNSVQNYVVEENSDGPDDTEIIDVENNMENYYTATTPTEIPNILGDTFMFPANIDDLNDENLLRELAGSSEQEMYKSILLTRGIIGLASKGFMKESLSSASLTNNITEEDILKTLSQTTDPKESLKIMMHVFGSAYHRIFAHLKIVNAHDEASGRSFYDKLDESEIETESKSDPTLELETKFHLGPTDELKFESDSDFTYEVQAEDEILFGESSPQFYFVSGLPQSQFRVNIRKNDGHFLKTISFGNADFVVKYRSADYKSINAIQSAKRDPCNPFPLSIPMLSDMRNRSMSYISGRLTTSKYHIHTVTDEMIKIIQHFFTGKYSKVSDIQTLKITSKFRNKLKEINVYSGLICQISGEFCGAVKNFRSGVLKIMQLNNRTQGELTPTVMPTFIGNEQNSSKHAMEAILPVEDSMNEIVKGLQEVYSIMKMSQESIASLNYGIKIKPKHMKIINQLLESIRQLEFNRDVDFGAILMALVTDTITLQNLRRFTSVSEPEAQIDLKRVKSESPIPNSKIRALYNFIKLYQSFSEMVKLTKKLSLLSSFIACKSMEGLRRFCITKNGKTYRAGNIEDLYGKRLIFKQETYQIAIPTDVVVPVSSGLPSTNDQSEPHETSHQEEETFDLQVPNENSSTSTSAMSQTMIKLKNKLENISPDASKASSLF